MSDLIETETETTDHSNEEKQQNKFEIPTEIRNYLKENYPEVLNYINYLEKLLKKQKRKLKKYKSKFKTKPTIDNASQTDIINDVNLIQSKSISDEIKEAAELATQNSGFIYDDNSGLYYDSNTGYYYNAEYGLYYDANTGTYMSYNQETKTYEFHSQVEINRDNHTRNNKEKKIMKRKHKNEDKRKAEKSQRLMENDSAEEGECSQSNSDGDAAYDDDDNDDSKSDNSDVVKQWPPCMRIIVEQSKIPSIKIGTLHILTYKGGTLGREGDHDILLPDINISKYHLKFTYDETKRCFYVIDLGSRNGTILNGKRMSSAKQESEPFEVAHGSRIQISSVILLCHIHDGNKTCGLCEPGLIQIPDEKNLEDSRTANKTNQHKLELKNLRKKFGVSNYDDTSKLASGYTDRAQQRRDTVGSQNPHEKTEIASIEESIPSQNKGFKMLSKMGWKEGDSLGKDSTHGILEPIKLVSNPGTSGIGNNMDLIGNVDNYKKTVWNKTQDRFNQATIDTISDDESD